MPAGTRKSPGPFSRAVSAEIRAVMARSRLSQSKLSELTGLSPNYISKCLNDKQPFTLADLEAVAQALGISPDVLIKNSVAALDGGGRD